MLVDCQSIKYLVNNLGNVRADYVYMFTLYFMQYKYHPHLGMGITAFCVLMCRYFHGRTIGIAACQLKMVKLTHDVLATRIFVCAFRIFIEIDCSSLLIRNGSIIPA